MHGCRCHLHAEEDDGGAVKLAALALAAAMLCASGAVAGGSSPPGVTFKGRTYDAELWAAVVPDPQNYCSASIDIANPTAADLAEGARQLNIMVDDIVAMRPDFVLITGDLGDQSNGTGYDPNDIDNFTTRPDRYAESVCQRTNMTDRFDEAGIPWLTVFGNHDSYRDAERVWPRAEFMLKSYAYAAQNEVDRWHAGFADTEQRAALFQTPIGPICAVGLDYQMDPTGGVLDNDWATTNYGCGANHPTISVRHYGPAVENDDIAYNELFLHVYGHATAVSVYQTVTLTANGGAFEMYDLFTNSQESSLDCGAGTSHDGRSVHTGTGWWTVVRVVPEVNTITVQARDSMRGGQSGPSRCGWLYENTIISYSPSLCTRFPSMKGC